MQMEAYVSETSLSCGKTHAHAFEIIFDAAIFLCNHLRQQEKKGNFPGRNTSSVEYRCRNLNIIMLMTKIKALHEFNITTHF